MVRSITSNGVMPSAVARSAIFSRAIVFWLGLPFGRPAPGRFPPRVVMLSPFGQLATAEQRLGLVAAQLLLLLQQRGPKYLDY